jgi:16S rRNA (adenine1518-N6/adenine1519-N6)-dimethyltransferase
MSAPPGSRTYGVPSVKLAWFADVRRTGSVPRTVFWPVPRVDSGLVAFTKRDPPVVPGAADARPGSGGTPQAAAAGQPGGVTGQPSRPEVFAVVDAAFAQRRKTLRAALAPWAGSASAAEQVLRNAGIDPALRGESLAVAEFARIALAGRDCAAGRS